MLPFSRPIVYGNMIDYAHWYNGTELMAFDSLNYNTSGFTDYVGNQMTVSTYVTGGSVPAKDSKPLFNGTGIRFLYGGVVARVGMDVSTWLNTAWTLDYWTCQSASTATMQLSCSPIAVYPTTAYNTYTNRFLVAEANGFLYQWNNSTTGTSWGKTYTDLLSTSYVHFALVYDGSTFKVFTNGVLQQTINKGSFSLPTPTTSQVVGPLGQGGYQPTKFSTIERYRLRRGAVWTSDFNTSTIYN